MGREIRRVPLDFNHPIGEVWPGFLNEHHRECPYCQGRGSTAASEILSDAVTALMHGSYRLHSKADKQELAALTVPLAGRDLGGFGHDAIDRWHATKKIIELAGLDPDVWGVCQKCEGTGVHPAHRAAYDAWEAADPPSGEGWQMWETVSEGSPVTPVFATADALIDHLVAEEGYSPQSARAFVNQGWAPSLVMAPGMGVKDGITAAGIFAAKDNEHKDD